MRYKSMFSPPGSEIFGLKLCNKMHLFQLPKAILNCNSHLTLIPDTNAADFTHVI
jgi:hypothetical protein